jgi:hypothetical protein
LSIHTSEASTYSQSDTIDAHPDAEIADDYYIDYSHEYPNAYFEHDGASEYGGSEMYDENQGAGDWGEEGEEFGTDYGDEREAGEGEGGFEEDGGEELADECVDVFLAMFCRIVLYRSASTIAGKC